MFGSSFNLAAAGLGDLPSDILVPGVAVFSRRALPLAAWTNGLEISGTPANMQFNVMHGSVAPAVLPCCVRLLMLPNCLPHSARCDG
jgi:hypothetical protein